MNAALDALIIMSLLMYPDGTNTTDMTYSLDSFSAEPVKAVACSTKDLPQSSIEETLDNIVFDGISVSVVRTKDDSVKAAIRNIFEYTEFYTIDTPDAAETTDANATDSTGANTADTSDSDTSDADIVIEVDLAKVDMDTFTNLLGQRGIIITYDDGSDTTQLYFTFDGNTPLLMLESDNKLTRIGEYLFERDLDSHTESLYRYKNEQLYKYSLDTELMKLTGALDVTVSYMPNYRYLDHDGLFLIDCRINEDYNYENYVGWLENGELTIVKSSETILPPYKYTPTKPNTDEAATEWLNKNLGGEFILADKIDPSLISGDLLKSYMGDAYKAGTSILRVFYLDSSIMYVPESMITDYSTIDIYYAMNTPYIKMNNPAFSNLSAFETYMREILSDELVDSLMAKNMFIDYNGELWGVQGTRGSNIHRTLVETKITNVTDTDITYVCVVEERPNLDEDTVNIIELEYHYTKTDSGWRWISLDLYN